MQHALDETAIAEILTAALLNGRLAPGLKLGEHQLATTFGVTRERIRKVLHRLGHQRLIDLHPNRGAFVAKPGLKEARDVYHARRILEGGVVSHLASNISQPDIDLLQEHLRRERSAADANDHAEAVRLSGLFHAHLADMTRNDFIVRHMQELVSRTAMLVAYHETQSSRCGCDEHAAIFEAISARDPGRAAREMHLHLSMIETRLQEPPVRAATVNVDKVLADEIRRWNAARRKRRGGGASPAAGRRRKEHA